MFTGMETVNKMDSMIKDVIRNYDFWGQLDISRDELEKIRERMSVFLGRGILFEEFFKQYPYVTVTYIVFLCKFQYNGDFWGMISDEVGIEKIAGGEQSRIGRMILSTFKKNGFDFSGVHDNARIYVDTVLYEIGEPPESNLRDLFYIFKYGSMGNADPQLLIDQITSESYGVHKPLLHFFQDSPEDISTNFVLDIQDAYLSALQTDDLSGKYARAYSEWVELDKEKAKSRNAKDDEKVEVRPRFLFDNGKKGLCIVLPRQDMEEEWVETANWVIEGDENFSDSKECYVQGSEGKRYTEQIIVQVKPCESYKIYFEYDDGFDKHTVLYELKGIGSGQFFYFNSNGNRISPSYLRSPYAVILYSKDCQIKTENVLRDIQNYPLLTTNYVAEQISPIYTDSQVVIDTGTDTVILRMKPQLATSLSGKRLFNSEYIESEVPIFTEIPELHLTFDGFASAENVEIRIGDVTLEAKNLDVEYENIVDISNAFEREIYGIVSARIYQFSRFIKQVRFCILPEFYTTFDTDLSWPLHRVKAGMVRFSIQKVADWDIKFKNASIQDITEKYVVSVPYSEGVLQGTVVSTRDDLHLSVDFEMPICAFKAELVSSNELAEKCDLDDFLNGNPWESISFYGPYIKDEYEVLLQSVDGIEQRKQIKLSSNGAVNVDLNVFRDTIQASPLPVKLSIYNRDTEDEFDLLLIDEVVKFKKRPAYAKKRNAVGIWDDDVKSDVFIEKYGDEYFSLELKYSDTVVNEAGWRVFSLEDFDKLLPGYYRVVRESSVDDLFMMEERFTITMATDQFFVMSKDKVTPVDSFSTWLETAVSEILKHRKHKQLQELKGSDWYLQRGLIIEYENESLSDSDILNLVILGSMIDAKISSAHKDIINDLMKMISLLVLSDVSRYRIIEKLIDVKANDFVFDKCIKNYALMTFDHPNGVSRDEVRNLAGEVKRFSTKLALVMLMKLEVPIKETLGNPTYRDTIGVDGITSMMETNAPEEKRNEDRKHFLLEDGQSTVHISIPVEMSGINQFYEMIDQKKTRFDHIYLDKKKIPDTGIYLNGNRYTDLFVNWYIRNHPHGEAIKEETNTLMRDTYKAFLNNVYYKLNNVKKNEDIGYLIREYDVALSRRSSGNYTTFSLPNYFYFIGLAALIIQMPAPQNMTELWQNARRFYVNALPIAPHITERDFLMASTFLYLRKKER